MRRRSRLCLVAVLGLLASLLLSLPAEAVVDNAAPVFINELHYDNTGADAGEFVEIAGPAGADLEGWSVVLYNGNGGSSYGTVALSGIVPDQDEGFGTLSFSQAGIQNGGPDGLALVDDTGAVIEFLSYEGSFVGVGGPADGLESTDIGVSEPGSTALGLSLQKTGTGTSAGEFTWQGPAGESPGAVNTGQDFGAGGGEPPSIAEIHYDNAGSDTGEFVEIEGAAGTDLTGWTLVPYNGNGGTQYNATALVGIIDDEGAGRGAVSFPIAGLQNGSPDGVALVDPDGAVVEFLSYEGSFTAADGPANGSTSTDIGVSEPASTPIGQSLQLIDGAWTGPSPESPGLLNSAAPPAIVPIHDVQGSGRVAALDGQTVTVQGIVTSLFSRDDALDGFFVQEEDADADADPATSEGIFIFCRLGAGCPNAIAVGDQVTVIGSVTEFFDMTQIDTESGSIVIDSSGNPLPTAVTVDLPASGRTDDAATFEAVEAMVVAFPDKLVVSEYFQLGRFGQVVLTADARPLQFTGTNAPSVTGFAAFQDDLASRRIILDDDNNDQNDTTSDSEDNEIYPWPVGGLSTTNFFRGGDSITRMTGVLHWSFAGQSGTDAWRVRPIDGVDNIFSPDNARPASPADVGGRLQVASFNVLNYFTTLDEPGAVCGPSAIGCRGAHSSAELDRQRAKIVAAMAELDADILGLVEIENDEGAAAADLVAELNTATAPGTYAAIDTGSIGGDAIKVALIYQPASVTPVGDFAILDSSVDARFIDSKNRPVLIQTFDEAATGARMTVAVNHLKSKGSPCDDVGDPGLDDGQGNCNLTRTTAAQAMADYLATDPTGSGDADILIIGDLNAYAMEDPITALEAAGYTDLIETFEGPSAYSFVFDGQLGYLDHALANEPLLPQVTGVSEWHINADEINLFDYNDDIEDAAEASFERESSNGGLSIFDADPYRSSDHDPVIIGLELTVPGPSCNGQPATIVGTERGEIIRGTRGPDVIVALGGNDRIFGYGGDDVICAGDGNDRVFGGGGKDTIFGENGRDRLFGSSGDDTVSGDEGDDRIFGGFGNDSLDGGPGRDRLAGSRGTDTCTTGETLSSCEL